MNSFRHPLLHPSREAGFTILELVIVMGILSGFLVMLVQLVGSGLSMFGEGELGQALADRASQAQRVITRELGTLRGTATGRDRDAVDDRLVVQMLPIGLPPSPERGATRVQVLRGAVHLPVQRELDLIDAMLTTRIMTETPNATPEMVAEQVAKLRQQEPLRGVGNMLLLPFRQEGDDDSLLELRAGWFLPGQEVPLDRDRTIDPFKVPVPGSAQLPGLLVYNLTRPVLQNLLHVEFLFWSQGTKSWGSTSSGSESSADATAGSLSAPQHIWDSSRGGWLVDEQSGGTFAYDRGPASLDDATDDIQPHAILVRCVVAQPSDVAPEGLLAQAINADDTSLVLYNGDKFPGSSDGGWIKLHGEWMHYGERTGDQLLGLRRGQRRTKALSHEVGSRIHIGRTVEFVVPVLHAKDDWNG